MTKYDDLDTRCSAYTCTAPFALDNELIIKGYANRILEIAHGTSLLELGIGHGYSCKIFAEKFKRHVIIEGSKEIIDSFVKSNVDIQSSIYHSLFEEYTTTDKFDIIVIGFVLEHVDDPIFILKKYKRFLKKKGIMFVVVPNAMTLVRRIGYAAGMLDDYMKLTPFDIELGHKRSYTVSSLKETIKNAGLNEVRTEGVFLKTMTTDQLERLQLPKSILMGMIKVGINYPELCVGIMEVCNENRIS